MHIIDRLLRRTRHDETIYDVSTLPRFSFESDDRPLVSTERLFRQFGDEESQYDGQYTVINQALKTEQDIIVSTTSTSACMLHDSC